MWSGLITAVMGVAALPLRGATPDAKSQAQRVCPGFVVLANGYAVLSEVNKAMPMGKGHDHRDQQMSHMTSSGHDQGGKQDQMGANHNPLMGYHHGQAMVAGKDEVCVPLGSPDETVWKAVSRAEVWSVTVESLRGPLAHNSRANEGFGITVTAPDGKPLDNAEVQLLVRMPQHDHGMPGGHGPANDPDVKGLAAMPDEKGHYRVQTVDFSMAGPWLLQIVVRHDGDTFNAYVAPSVGEE
jgi:hypothetical protein